MWKRLIDSGLIQHYIRPSRKLSAQIEGASILFFKYSTNAALMHARRFIHIFKNFSFGFIKKRMTDKSELKDLQAKAVEAEKLVSELRAELTALRTVFNAVAKAGSVNKVPNYDVLIKENESLKKEIEHYKSQLKTTNVNLQVDSKPIVIEAPVTGKPQIQVPETKESVKKPPKEKKAPVKPATEDKAVDIGRLDLRIGKIIECKKHPDADSLYIEQVDVGEGKPRTVISGLVKFVPIEEMQNRMVVLLCNLKPAKMRGILSEAMVMCASTPEKVEILTPPVGSLPGDLVEVDGFPRVPDAVLNPKLKIFETVAPELKTNVDKVATYRGVPWSVPSKGTITATTLTGVNIK